MKASSEDRGYFSERTPNTPYYVITPNGRIDGQIHIPGAIYTKPAFKTKPYIEDIVFGGMSLKR